MCSLGDGKAHDGGIYAVSRGPFLWGVGFAYNSHLLKLGKGLGHCEVTWATKGRAADWKLVLPLPQVCPCWRVGGNKKL